MDHRIEPPRKIGETKRPKTTMGVYRDTRDVLVALAIRWGTTLQEATRYLVDIGNAGLVGPPAPDVPVAIDYRPDVPPESIEAQAVALVDAIVLQRVTAQEARVQISTLIRQAGCEARASWVKEKK